MFFEFSFYELHCFGLIEEPVKPRIPLEVLRQEMNVPMAAILAIARSENVETDSQSEYISEDSLGVYADAYIRKLKEYFRRMTHDDDSLLDIADIITFEHFCEAYKKSSLNDTRVRSWDDIDQESIRENFFQRVISKVSAKKREERVNSYIYPQYYYDPRTVLDSLCPYGSSLSNKTTVSSPEETTIKAEHIRKCRILSLVAISPYYYQKKRNHPPLSLGYRPNSIRLIHIVSHYQIYPSEEPPICLF